MQENSESHRLNTLPEAPALLTRAGWRVEASDSQARLLPTEATDSPSVSGSVASTVAQLATPQLCSPRGLPQALLPPL
jgi:hypothetical protein